MLLKLEVEMRIWGLSVVLSVLAAGCAVDTRGQCTEGRDVRSPVITDAFEFCLWRTLQVCEHDYRAGAIGRSEYGACADPDAAVAACEAAPWPTGCDPAMAARCHDALLLRSDQPSADVIADCRECDGCY